MTRPETNDDITDDDDTEGTGTHADEAPVVLSPGDSDAPDAPDPGTVYPDEQGVPGGSED